MYLIILLYLLLFLICYPRSCYMYILLHCLVHVTLSVIAYYSAYHVLFSYTYSTSCNYFYTMSHVCFALFVFFQTPYSCTYILSIPCILCRHTLDTLFLNNHDHYSIITSIYFMCRCSYLSSLYCHVTSTISSNSRYKVIKT